VGYRQTTQRLVNDHHLVVGKETAREILKILDPERVELRARHRLKRRQYITKGPNRLWNIDGYIHGAIDGFSRRISWLHVDTPTMILLLFFCTSMTVRQLGEAARVIRADCGTEIGYIPVV